MPTKDTQREITAATYERVSTRLQGQFGYSLKAQHQSLQEFATSQGWHLPKALRFRDGEDANASGADWDLPGLTAMLEAGKRREFQVLIVPDLDRFARSLVKGLVLEEQLQSYGVRVVYQRVPVEDSPEGRLLKNQLFSFAEFEREKFVLRSLMGRQQKAKSGKVVGQSVAPFGYRYVYDDRGKPYDLELDPINAPIVKEALIALKTSSCQDVANGLNDKGIPTPRNRKWTARHVWRFATNPVYIGSWFFGGNGDYDQRVPLEERSGIEVSVPAIIDRSTWDSIQKALDRRKVVRRGRRPKEQDPYLMRGMLTCGHCRGALHTDSINRVRYYSCLRHKPYNARRYGTPICDLPSARAENLEAELWRVVTTTLLDPMNLKTGLEAAQSMRSEADVMRQERIAVIDGEITRQRKRLDTLASRIVDAGDGELYEALRRQASEIEKLLDRLVGEQTELSAVRSEGLSAEEARSIEAFAKRVAFVGEHATPAERRELYETLQIQGTLYDDPMGVKLTRRTHFRIDWQAVIPLRNSVTSSTRIGIPS